MSFDEWWSENESWMLRCSRKFVAKTVWQLKEKEYQSSESSQPSNPADGEDRCTCVNNRKFTGWYWSCGKQI